MGPETRTHTERVPRGGVVGSISGKFGWYSCAVPSRRGRPRIIAGRVASARRYSGYRDGISDSASVLRKHWRNSGNGTCGLHHLYEPLDDPGRFASTAHGDGSCGDWTGDSRGSSATGVEAGYRGDGIDRSRLSQSHRGLLSMKASDYDKCAGRIADALQLSSGESVLIKLDTRVFTPLVPSLQNIVRASGAHISGVILAEEATTTSSDQELVSMRRLFDNADVFIWLPEMHQGNRPALARALNEWLDARRGRAVHFHWQSGSFPIGFTELPADDFIDRMYLRGLDVDSPDLEQRHRQAMSILRSNSVRVTTPEGTDISFDVGSRPFCSQIGDASRARMQSAATRIDRDIELPAGVLRVAPIESSANGSVFLPVWRPIITEGRNLMLRFVDGHVTIKGVNADKIDEELTAAGGDARMFREFALGFNPALQVLSEAPFIAYYGYGAGVVRLSLGDNKEMGGANRGGGVYWNFLHNATVTVGNKTLVEEGKLIEVGNADGSLLSSDPH